MRSLFWIHVRDILSHPTKIFSILMINGVFLWTASLTGSSFMTGFGTIFTIMLLGSGIISEDYASSMLHLTLSRPIPRWQYVCSKWLALGAAAALCLLTFAALTFLLIYKKTGVFSGSEFGSLAVKDILVSFQGAALLVFLSTWMPWKFEAYTYMILSYPSFLGGFFYLFGLRTSLIERISAWVNPGTDLANNLALDGLPWDGLSIYFLAVFVCIGGACLVMNRKEISYAK